MAILTFSESPCLNVAADYGLLRLVAELISQVLAKALSYK